MISDNTFSITNTTKSKLPKVDFLSIKNAGIGEKYELSLVFVGEKKSCALNNKYRGKDEPTNILSFVLDKNEGEIFICLNKVKRETEKFGRKFDNLAAFLFIHGLMHLKGMEHGSTMEKAEVKLRNKFAV